MPRWVALLLLLLTACGASTRGMRPDSRSSGGSGPVAVERRMFEVAVGALGREVSISPRPREAARRLFADALPPRAYAARLSLGVVSKADVGRDPLLASSADLSLTRAYGHWCERKGGPRDCLRLLEEGPALDEEGRRTLAFQMALDSVWDETAEALKDLTDRDAIVAMLATTGAVYFGLWLLPEPVTKGVAAVLTVGLIAYLGWDTVWSLIQGFRVMAARGRDATSFGEIRDAGERYGAVMGKNAARVFLLLTTAALSGTAQTLAARLPTLPGAPGAALVGVGQGGLRLAAVETVAVSSVGVVSIAVDSTVVAMTADTGVHEHHIASNKWWDSTKNGGPWSPRFQRLFDRAGLSLDDPANKVRVQGHKGPHPREYHEEIFDRLTEAMRDCAGMTECREALRRTLEKMAGEINTPGTRLNQLVIRRE